MKIHSLQMQAIGAFKSKEKIDFDAFTQGSRFLLTGDTGSGKTTILDAICFGLYDRVSGDNRVAKTKIRSDHAADTTESWVKVVFSVPQGVYRVERSPQWLIPKRRGDGWTTKAAQCRLFLLADECDQAGTIIADKPRDCGYKLSEILPLSFEQFTQTVVLPQGLFSKFIQATSEERKPILQQVFGTEHFAKLETYLVEQAKDATDKAEEYWYEVNNCVQTIIQFTKNHNSNSAAIESLSLAVEQRQIQDLFDPFDDIEDSLQNAYEQAQLQSAIADASAIRAQDVLQLGTEQTRLIKRLQQLESQQCAIDAKLPEFEQLQTAIRCAESAQAILSAQRTIDQLSVQAVKAKNDWDSAGAQLAHFSLELPPELKVELTETGFSRLNHAIKDISTNIGKKTHLADLESGLEERADQLLAWSQELQDLAEQSHAINSRLSSCRDEICELEKYQQQQRLCQESLVQLQEDFQKWKLRFQAADLAREEQQKLLAQDSACQKLISALTQAQSDEVHLRQQWIKSAAGQLSLTLEPDTPCPVCGAKEHPYPAKASADKVPLEEVSKASAQVASFQEQIRASLTYQEQLREQVADYLERADGDIDDIAKGLENAQTRLDQAQKLANNLEVTEQKIQQSYDSLRTLTEELHGIESTQAQLGERLTINSKSYATDKKICELARGGYSSVQAYMDQLQLADNALCKTLKCGQDWKNIDDNLAQAQSKLLKELEESPFSNLSSAQQAWLPADELASASKKIVDFQAEQERVRLELTDDQLQGVKGLPEPDLASAREQVRQTKEAWQQASALTGAAQERCEQLQLLSCQLHHSTKKYQALIQAQAPLLRLSSLVHASDQRNRQSIPLSTYVLIARLDEVLEVANEHLNRISLGRYRLLSADSDVGSRSRKQGLGLIVFDQQTDKNRAVKDLSGGETFYCSLSLALALADVVSAEAGGIELGTMFIDEGFGTLDSSTREKVLEVLATLDQSHRHLGIISHVEELKTEINQQIRVIKSESGGSTLQVIY